MSRRRVVVKIGSSSLTTTDGGLDPDRLDALVDVLAAAHRGDDDIVLVSSGAIAAGLAPLGLPRRPRDLATQQAAASVGQGLLVHRYADRFAPHGLVTGQVLLTVDDVTRRGHYRNAYRTFERLRELGAVPVVNENDTVATTEIRFGDNDRLAALVAHLVHADLLVLLSDVDGLFDGDPRAAGTRRIIDVRGEADLEGVRFGRTGAAGVGTGGMVTKVEAARIATGAGIRVVLTTADQVGPALAGEQVGTRFHPTGSRRPTRLLWLAHATEGRGRLRARRRCRACCHRAPGVAAPGGCHRRRGHLRGRRPGRPRRSGRRPVARGLVNYDSDELPGLLGRSTRELARTLGAGYERELVHRDDLVLLGR